MKHSVYRYVGPGGERPCHIAENSTGLPVSIVNQYLISQFRNHNAAYKTIENEAYKLVAFYEFLSAHRIDIVRRVRDGAGLSLAEIDAFRVFAQKNLANTNVVSISGHAKD